MTTIRTDEATATLQAQQAQAIRFLSGDCPPCGSRGMKGCPFRATEVEHTAIICYTCGMEKPQATSLRLSLEAKRLLRLLAEKSGISMTAKLEVMIRNQARRERVQ